MRIASFGDIHLGTECDDDVMQSADEVIGKCKIAKPDLIVITGDVYDGSSNPDSRELAKNIVIRAADISPVVILKGNHDIRTDLLILGDLRARNGIKVYEYPSCATYPTDREPIFIHYLPWFTKSAWIAAMGNTDIKAGDAAVSLLALSYLRAKIAEQGSGKHLLYSHLMISGSKAENHQPLLGEGITFGYHDLVEAGFCGGAFGHIHLAQVFGDRDQGSPEFRYNGAIAALNYGESAADKSFSILDTDTMNVEVFPIHATKRVTFDAEWNGVMNFGGSLPSIDCQGVRVRIRLLVAEGYNADDGRKFLREYFWPIKPLELKIETQRRPIDQVRSAEIAAAKNAQDKLIAFWTATNTTPEEPMRSDMLRIAGELEAECLIDQ